MNSTGKSGDKRIMHGSCNGTEGINTSRKSGTERIVHGIGGGDTSSPEFLPMEEQDLTAFLLTRMCTALLSGFGIIA